jgi:hypothetical protein
MRAQLQALKDRPAQLAARRAEFKKRTEEYLASNCTPEERAEAERLGEQYAAQVEAELAAFCGFKLSAKELAGEKAARSTRKSAPKLAQTPQRKTGCARVVPNQPRLLRFLCETLRAAARDFDGGQPP